MWIEVRNLFDAVSQVHTFADCENAQELTNDINKYKDRLTNVLRNSQKSIESRNKIKPNSTITIDDIELTLDEKLCNEALILSDIFSINEIEAVDLVLAGEAQKVHFDGLNRGLIAVVCYYDTHRLLVTTLRKILEWDREEIPTDLLQIIDNTFIQEDVLKHLFELIATFSIQSEFSRLMQPNVNGLGGSKHQKLLRNAIDEIRNELLKCIFLLCENPGNQAIKIANLLFETVKNVPTDKLNNNNLTAWLCLIKLTSSEVLNKVQEASNVLNLMISHIRDETTWTDQPMCGTIQLACATSLKALASSPADHLGIENIKVDVDRVIDRAIRNMAFQYIRLGIIKSEFFNTAEQFVIVDELLKQIVSYFPAKLMEMERNSADELVWHDEQQKIKLESTNTMAPQHEQKAYVEAASNYEHFLRCFVDLYELQPDIDNNFNTKCEKTKKLHNQLFESSLAFSTDRSIELCRLLERARLPHHFVHSVAYLEMAAAVCRNSHTAAFLFDVFSREHPGTDIFGWESFMTALKSYDRMFRENKLMQNRSMILQNKDLTNRTNIEKPTIRAEELCGLISWLRLAAKVSYLDDNSANRFAEDRSWCVLDSVASLSSASVPLSLKAALLSFLNSIARLEISANRVWHVIHIYQLSYFSENGSLMGMQQELDEKECTLKQYDASLEFVRLISTLLKHKNLPDYAPAFIQFITKSVLSQFALRSYNDVTQMWKLAEESLRATDIILESGIVEPRAVAENEVHIALLTQLLNDTPLFRSIARIILEDFQAQSDPYISSIPLSSYASLFALKLLSRAIVLNPALRACARVSSSDVIVSSIQSLVFTQIHSSSSCTILDLIFHYLQMSDEYPLHALHSVRIFRDVLATKGSTQSSMLEILKSRDSAGFHVRAVRTALCVTSINYTIDDSLHKDIDVDCPLYARGEIARILLETLSDAADGFSSNSSKYPNVNNICYYLLAFRPSKANTKELYDNDELLTGLHYVLYIIEQFIQSKDPFSLPFSALLEPAFRLMQRLVSLNCPFSRPVLCFMRSSNIIEQLVTSPFICSALALEDKYETNFSTGLYSVRQMIAGYILHFAAVEISAMLTTGHFTRPETLYRALLETSSQLAEYTMNDDEDEGCESSNLLFSLLRRATIPRQSEILYPSLVHFDVNKLHELFDSCLTVTIYGIPQYDIEYLDRLLRREISSVYSECDDIRYAKKEMQEVLEYCAEVNANLLSEGANDRIVSGCTALFNIFSVFAPVHFFSTSTQLIIFRDACYVLIEMISGIGGASQLAACQTLFRLVCTVTKLAQEEFEKLTERRKFYAPLFKSLIELLVQSSEKTVDSKVCLYKTLRTILRAVFEKDITDTNAEDWLLDGHYSGNCCGGDEIVNVIDSLSESLSRHLATSITDFPKHRKSTVVLLTNDLIHEDLKGAKKLSSSLSQTGICRLLCDELLSMEFDWNVIGGNGSAAALSVKNEQMSEYKLVTSILTLFTRIAATEQGWQSLAELSVTEVISEMEPFRSPPKEIFLKPETIKQSGTVAHLFGCSLDLALHVCKQMCTKTKWKKLSLKVLATVQSFGDIFQQLIRADIECSSLKSARDIVSEIATNDEVIGDAVDCDNVLRQLKNCAKKDNETGNKTNMSLINANSSFAAPRQLFSTIMLA